MAGYIGSKASVTQVDGYNRAEADAEFVNDPNDVITVSSGNVGIGTSSPGAKLEVAGETRIYPSSGTANLRFGSGGSEKGKMAVDASSNMVFETAGLQRMSIDASGRVTMPGQPAFHAVGGGGFTPSQGQVLPFTTAITNRGSHYNISTQRFTAPVGGVYLLTTRATWGGSGTGSVPFIAINGIAVGGAAAYTEIFGYNTVNGYHTTSAVAAPVSMNAGDYADVRVTIYNSSVSSFDLTRSSFGGYLIG